jgi:hypothetical protein
MPSVIDFRDRSFKGVEIGREDGIDVLTVSDPHALTQISGFFRYAAAPGRTFFRGESKLHTTVLPSLFRDPSGPITFTSLSNRQSALKSYIDRLSVSDCVCPAHTAAPRRKLKFRESHLCTGKIPRRPRGALIPGTFRAAVEPLLQHYGIRTRWLDLVDNVWIALWFACHEQKTEYEKTGNAGSTSRAYAYHLRRSPFDPTSSSSHYAYIYMFSTGVLNPTEVPGYELSKEHRLIDLRYATPSVYLRPHAQHGLLLANRTMPSGDPQGAVDQHTLNSALSGIIRIRLGDALDWLGSGALTDVFNLFPPAYSDLGYRKLLNAEDAPHSIGAITNYQGGI